MSVVNSSVGARSSAKLLPDFAVIGAMKAGTTSLHAYLSAHPEICMSSRKDTNFFADRHHPDRDFAWYHRLFADPSKLAGETSAGYSQYPLLLDVARNMTAANPDVKIIYVLRDPINRLLSHYMHNVAQGRENRTIGEALGRLDRNNYINSSRYWLQLEQYLAYLPSSRILTVISEDLFSQRARELQRVFCFLKVDPEFVAIDFDRILNRTSDMRRSTALGRALATVPLLGRLKSRLPFAGRRVDRPILHESLQRRLGEILKPDIEALQNFTGNAFDAWTVFRKAIS